MRQHCKPLEMLLKKTAAKHVKYAQAIVASSNFGTGVRSFLLCALSGRHLNKLEGKIALITEGSTGIDLATAQHFVSKGASVSITGRRQRELDVAVSQNATAMQGTAHSRTRKQRRVQSYGEASGS